MLTASRHQVIAFRLAAHHLDHRADAGTLADVAGACGAQDSPPGSALIALHARVQGVTPRTVTDALERDKTLVRTWCMRGAPFCVPTADLATFTTGALPPDEDGRLHLLQGVAPALRDLGMPLAEAVALIHGELGDVLAGRRLAIDELGLELAEHIAGHLPAAQRATWLSPGPYAPGQPLGEAVVHFCLRILTLQGVVCFAERAGRKAPFVLVEEWLGRPMAQRDPAAARADLLRRYLHCYGPSTRADFAAWLGVQVGDASPWWDAIESELTAVEYRGTSWLLTQDLDALRSAAASAPSGARLLPPRDPYTQAIDRETIAPPEHHRAIWQTVGSPGAVMLDGEIVGTWRARKAGRRLAIAISTFTGLAARDQARLGDEATAVADVREATATDIEFVGPE